jgi:HD-like signal output (HDOD) protein
MDLGSRKVELWSAAMAPDPDMYEVAARVATIPDTAAAVVRYANSAYVGAVYPVGTVMEAVIRVGCRSVGALAMASLNRDLIDAWGAPELWEESLVVGRAAKLLGRLLGFPRSDNEHLFVAGLFSCAGAAGLTVRDGGFLAWRRKQAMQGYSDLQIVRRERMAYETDHLKVGNEMLQEWGLPVEIIGAVAAHHEPVTELENALATAMCTLDNDSPTRCLSTTLKAAMKRLGLESHVSFVETESQLFAEVTAQVFASSDDRKAAIA